MRKPLCIKCQTQFRVAKVGVTVVTMFSDPPVPGSLIKADLFVVTILDSYMDHAGMFPDREILGVAATMATAMQMAEERLEKSYILKPVWYKSPTGQWAHTDTVSELLGAEICAYDVVQ